LRRAKAVESELLRRGIDSARIEHVSGTDEAIPPVRTGDEVREPSNRAVVIRVERGDPKSM
jgi:outer membrane protein OmpA-like peptidoglycan-associated protein